MVVAIGQADALDSSRFGRQHIAARVADEQGLLRRNAGHFHDKQQGGRVGLFLRQGIAADDPAEIAADLHLIEQGCNEALGLVGDQGHFHALLVQPLEGVAHAGVDHRQLMTFGVGLHEQLQAPLGFVVIDRFVVDAASQGATHQHRRTIADPVAHRLKAGGLTPHCEQHVVHRRCQVRYRIDQGTVQIKHHQFGQGAGEQLLEATHGRARASSACILAITSR
ncbi:hypothetical protein D3C81_1409320 [compost metagenome]